MDEILNKTLDDLSEFLKTIGWTCTICGATGNGEDEVYEHNKKYHSAEDD